MSASHAPQLSQLIRASTPNPIKAGKTALRGKFIAASAALRGQELGIDTKIDAADGPTVAEADEAYEKWVAKEIARRRTDEDMQMEEVVMQAAIEQGASAEVPAATEKMSHIEVVSHPVWKRSWQMVVESEDEDEPKITIPPGSILHKVPCMRCTVKNTACIGPIRRTCNGCTQMKQGCEKSTKATGKKVQTGTPVTQSSRAAKAGPSKRAADNDKVEVVESYTRAKGKAPVCSQLDPKVAADLLQLLRLLHMEAMESHAAYLQLQVRMDQLAKALEKIGVE
ncbi:hypothetical protein M404DRAFT_28829 [Pisolithus tinctorius Marx 270]|uniref:Zn(2)-C6 fungal-type domain-containing protein n=1 Tax=Pisolithus tinctorius Marx 270 TaxID=870435 RepID=A0A0C3JV15_PISTI|nr:hypothetical protein M404DRAFT_28829 [Pisolithus tinctorius Marx 270]